MARRSARWSSDRGANQPEHAVSSSATPSSSTPGKHVWGRVSLLSSFLGVAALELWLLLSWSELENGRRVGITAGRLALTLALMVLLYQGARWARFVYGILMALGCITGMYLAFTKGMTQLWYVATVQAGAVYAVLISSSVHEFLASQELRRDAKRRE